MTERGYDVEGRVPTQGGTLWYGVCGDLASGRVPLLVIHGGPGMSHDYLWPLSDLRDICPVIFYDQLDAGKSDRPNLPQNWSVDRFLGEIHDIRRTLGLSRAIVFGNSWGGTLAAAYAASRPDGLERIILSSPLLNTDVWRADNARYRAALPAPIVAVMDRNEADGTTGAPEYLDSVDAIYRRHLCRADPWPDYVDQTFEVMNETCYAAMWGPNEFTCTGVLRGYDGTGELSGIAVPTLVTCGAFDKAAPETTRKFAAMIPDARFEIIPDASHMAFVEQRAQYIRLVRGFLEEGLTELIAP